MGTLRAPTPLWARVVRKPGPQGCQHVRWPDGSRPTMWTTSVRLAVEPEDVRRLTNAAAMSAAHRGLYLDRNTVHVCRITDERRVWLAVARPPRARSPRWQWTSRIQRWLGIR